VAGVRRRLVVLECQQRHALKACDLVERALAVVTAHGVDDLTQQQWDAEHDAEEVIQ